MTDRSNDAPDDELGATAPLEPVVPDEPAPTIEEIAEEAPDLSDAQIEAATDQAEAQVEAAEAGESMVDDVDVAVQAELAAAEAVAAPGRRPRWSPTSPRPRPT